MASTLLSKYFSSTRLGHTIKGNSIKIQNIDTEI